MFPVLVIITICCIRIRNIRDREKRIKDWAKDNRISKGIVSVFVVSLSTSYHKGRLPKIIGEIWDSVRKLKEFLSMYCL